MPVASSNIVATGRRFNLYDRRSRNCIGRGDDKVCACPEGQTLCKKPRGEGRCANLQTNERHCGSCFNRCAEGEECVDGVCGGGEPICDPPCPAGEECTEGVQGTPPFCRPTCGPSCPECVCNCLRSGDGSGNVCVAFGVSPGVDSCEQCPTPDFPENTICADIAPSPDVEILTCERPCP
jgi:hypothetical protein